MISNVLIVLMLIGSITTGAAVLWAPPANRQTTARTESAPIFFGVSGMAIWIIVAYGASSLDIIDRQQGTITEGAHAEPALVVLGAGLAILTLFATVAAATETYSNPLSGGDRPVSDDTFKP